MAWTTERFRREGFESARLDAELLLAHALEVRRLDLYLDHDRVVGAGELDRFRDLVRRRLEHEPVAYLTGRKEFWSLELRVDPRVLVPRPETEVLVEVALDLMRGRTSPRVLDVGTGSGAIALAIAKERPESEVVASDVSADALAVAADNAARLGLHVTFLRSDLLEAEELRSAAPFDLVLANLPYLRPEEVGTFLRFEPRGALTCEDDGLGLTQRLIQSAGQVLKAGGYLCVEVAADRAGEVRSAFASVTSYEPAETRRDLAGRDRVLVARWREDARS